MEFGLEISCPEAARLILTEEDALLCETLPGGESGDYDSEWMAILRETRPFLLELLADETREIPQTLAILLLYAYHVQQQIDGVPSDPFDADAALLLANELALTEGVPPPEALFLELEILTEDWRRLLQQRQGMGWFPVLRRFARYGVLRYYYQAVSDGDVVARIKMIILSCILIARIAPKGEEQRAVQLYGKEIENNLDNVETILAGAYTHPAMTDRALLGWLVR